MLGHSIIQLFTFSDLNKRMLHLLEYLGEDELVTKMIYSDSELFHPIIGESGELEN